MEKRVNAAWLLDFYGPLITDTRREMLRLYWEEDLSMQEIAEQFSISRQGVSDAVRKAESQLAEYEEKLGLVKRYRRLAGAVADCRQALTRVHVQPGSEAALQDALDVLMQMDLIER